jgi:hypothetical protein
VGGGELRGSPFIEQVRRWRVGCASGGSVGGAAALMASRHGGASGDAAQRRRDGTGRHAV